MSDISHLATRPIGWAVDVLLDSSRACDCEALWRYLSEVWRESGHRRHGQWLADVAKNRFSK